jgi:hypothetical protein
MRHPIDLVMVACCIVHVLMWRRICLDGWRMLTIGEIGPMTGILR